MNALELALYNKLNVSAVTDLLDNGGSSIFRYMAPPNEDPPYIIISKQSNLPRYTMGGTAFENALYTVKAVTVGHEMAPAGTIATQIDAALNDQTLSISGYTHMRCHRENDVAFVEVDPGGQRWNHNGALYRIFADPT